MFKCPLCGMYVTEAELLGDETRHCPACGEIIIGKSKGDIEGRAQVNVESPRIHCAKCGAPNAENNFRCVACREVLYHPDATATAKSNSTVQATSRRTMPVERVSSYLLQAILCTM